MNVVEGFTEGHKIGRYIVRAYSRGKSLEKHLSWVVVRLWCVFVQRFFQLLFLRFFKQVLIAWARLERFYTKDVSIVSRIVRAQRFSVPEFECMYGRG